MLAINTDRRTPRRLTIPVAAERYTMSSATGQLETRCVRLNEAELALGRGDGLPPLVGEPVRAGHVILDSATITFLAMPEANNSACR